MQKKYTNKEIINALKQAEANIDFEDIKLEPVKQDSNKVLRKEIKNDQRRRFD